MISKKLLIFTLVFIIFQYIFLITELHPYLNMCSDIQGYKYNWFKSQDNKPRLIPLIIFTLGYPVMLLIFYYFLREKLYKINLYSFLFIVLMYTFWDFGYYIMFDKALKHLPVLLYDIFIVGGLSLVLTQFIFNKFYKILEKNIPILGLLYVTAMFSFLYVSFKYNPDVSNITGIYQPFHVLFMIFLIFLIVALPFCYNLLKLK
jgi:hypothetical protein